ncbi:flagellar hook-length control protein FliK [Stappia sp.]|uniref:flagellar hook-length control protein FliK n=1 Tax=Stappia sp. TaxID=1870903 RepID=UPI0032D99A4B
MVSRVSTPAGVVAVTPTTRLPPLSVGDVIAMRVARHLGDGVMRLISGGFQMDVAGQEMFPVGARVSLQIERGAAGPRYHLRADPETPVAPSREAAALARLTGLTAGLAADQDGFAPLYAGLSATAAAASGAGRTLSLPPALMSAIAAVLGFRMPADAGLDGARLREALRRLAGTGKGTPGAKPGLLDRLDDLDRALAARAEGRDAVPRQATPPPPPGLNRHPRGQAPEAISTDLLEALGEGDARAVAAQLLAKSKGATARARLAALVSAGLTGQETAGLFDLTLDLPIRVGPETAVLSLQIGRDETPPRDGEPAHPAWRLRFGLDLDETGPVEAVVGLDGARVFATLWAERTETRDAFAARLADLRATLAAQGLEVVDLKVLAGRPSDPPLASGRYVDRRS